MRSLFAAGLFLGINIVAFAQDKPKPAYDFSLPREDRIKLAESAAPPEISGKAAVYVTRTHEPSASTSVQLALNPAACPIPGISLPRPSFNCVQIASRSAEIDAT